MPLGSKSITGLTHDQANDSLPFASIPGDSGGPVSAVVLFVTGEDLPPSDGTITLQLFPTGKFTNGTDSDGNISVTATLVNSGDDKSFNIAGGGAPVVFTEGFWKDDIRGVSNTIVGVYGFSIQFSYYEFADFDPTLIDSPTNVTLVSSSWDAVEEEGKVDLSFSYDNGNAENPTSLAVVRDGVFVGYVPWVDGTTDYTYSDYIFAPGDYVYEVYAYLYGAPNLISGPSASISVPIGAGLPDISAVGGMDIALDFTSSVIFISDPSGIYTLVPDKTHDTLYNRVDTTSVDVKIPDPFIKTALVP